MAKRIPALDNLDLYSINETISRINSAFEEIESNGVSIESMAGDEVIWNQRIEVGTTEITKSDLKLDSGTYKIHLEATGGSACDYYLYFNRDKAGANYRAVRISSANGAAVTAAGTDNPVIGENEASGLLSMVGTITIDKLDNQLLCLYSYVRQPTDLYVTGCFHWEDFQAHEYVNHLSLTSSVEGGLGKGSHIIIWRIATT